MLRIYWDNEKENGNYVLYSIGSRASGDLGLFSVPGFLITTDQTHNKRERGHILLWFRYAGAELLSEG